MAETSSSHLNLVAIDIETKSRTKNLDDALIPHLAEITCIGVWNPRFQKVYRDLHEFQRFLDASPEARFVGQNFKFDLKHLIHAGIQIDVSRWADDTQLMAASHTEKIPDSWLADYELRRMEQNKLLPRGFSHRKASKHSLKTLAPYFLGIPAFWEDPSNHDNDSYVLKDCEYCYRLCALLTAKMQEAGTYKFYKEKLFKWNRDVLLRAELSGISLDVPELKNLKEITEAQLCSIKDQIDVELYDAYAAHYTKLCNETFESYKEKKLQAIDKLKEPTAEKLGRIQARYTKLFDKAIDALPFQCNLNSPSQLLWILQDSLKLVCKDFNNEDSTGIEVLEKLKTKHSVIPKLIEFREKTKIATAFIPTYLKLQKGRKIYTTFHGSGTRTGRLSSSDPNLQQVPGGLHSLFRAEEGYKLITKDMSAIEPHLVAYYSEDATLFKMVKEFHAHNVRVFFPDLTKLSKADIKQKFPNEYALAKEVGLACLYGAGAKRVQQSAQKYGFNWELPRCQGIIQSLKNAYPDVFEFKRHLDLKAAKEPITNLFGRKINFVGLDDEIYMKAFNTLIQSSASDLVLNSAQRMTERFASESIDAKVLMLIHDEVVVEVLDAQTLRADEIIREAMTDYDLPTPLGPIKLEVEGKIGDCWEK